LPSLNQGRTTTQFPKREPAKINLKKLSYFLARKSDRQLTTDHHQTTTNSPSKNHVQHTVFSKTPNKNIKKPSTKNREINPLRDDECLFPSEGVVVRLAAKSHSVQPAPKPFPGASNGEEGSPMRHTVLTPSIALLTLAFAISTQSVPAQNTQTSPAPSQTQPQPRSPGGDVGTGAGDVGKGTAKGTGAAAKGVGKGAGDLVTLHPINAAGNVGKGAGVAGKDVGVGAAKGTGKIAKGTGRGIGKIFHHGHHDETTPPQN
jgi:hypothetical protein